MKAITIMVKGLKETFRDRKGLAMLILFPITFMVVFGYAAGAFTIENTPRNITVINNDEGTNLYTKDGIEYINFGENFNRILNDLKYENSTTPMFTIHNQSRDDALDSLLNREISLIVTIPPDFSKSMSALINYTVREEIIKGIGQSIINDVGDTSIIEGFLEQLNLPVVMNIKTNVEFEGDPSYTEFAPSQSIVQTILMEYESKVIFEAVENTLQNFPAQLYPEAQPIDKSFVEISLKSVSGTEQSNPFDYLAPGLVIFGLLLMTMGPAEALARESEMQTLSRLKLSLMSSFDILLGTLLPWSIMALLQVTIFFGVAVLLGFQWNGGIITLLISVLIGVIAGIASVALGLIMASFAKNASQVATLGPIVAVPLSFMIGVFFQIPDEGFVEIVPWGQAVIAMRSILTFGNPISDIYINIAYMVIQTIILFLIGVVLFSRSKLKAL